MPSFLRGVTPFVDDSFAVTAIIAPFATTDETLALIEREQFHDSGCGAVDMALLASVLLTPETLLWTRDKNLDALTARLGAAFSAAGHTAWKS